MMTKKMRIRRLVFSIALLAAIFFVLVLIQPKGAVVSEHNHGHGIMQDSVPEMCVGADGKCACNPCKCCQCGKK